MIDNILLIGFMGSGKSTVGKELSKALDCKFIDMDYEIEHKENRSICDIFNTDGEDHFRKLETHYLQSLLKTDNAIISTGGGVVLKEGNRKLLKAIGKVIFLHADVEHIVKNVKDDTTRPLLQSDDYMKTITDMLESREDKYLSSADIIIQTSGKSVACIVDEIMTLL
ncbi:shikimate kinase [Vallitalea pronyensis]|uniref:Shikimate kinase n=1 Tax=Vallitalea pronyensis TaxID=1348613 RepID=A0A8J8SHV5_9FIRM|nr:shikimate kinase [Vallitalea pronyensis]QUI23818.1 shikimate kinase [Vallitalea pronyensis]